MPKEPGYVKAVKAYLAALERHGVTAERAYLFGSRGKGDARPDSDIDLIVVSPAFTGMPQWKRWEVLGDALSEVFEPIDVLAYSPEEFDARKDREASFLGHILKTAEALALTQRPEPSPRS
jgi:hypothetical protein